MKVTTDVLWRGAGLFAVLDLGLLLLLARWVTAARLRELRGTLLALTGVFWFCLWMVLVALVYWDRVYAYVFPAWMRWLLPLGVALLTTGAAAVALSLAIRLPVRPVVSFCLLGGVWGALTHAWAVFRGIVDKPPMLQVPAPRPRSSSPSSSSPATSASSSSARCWCADCGVASLRLPRIRRLVLQAPADK